MNDLGYVKIIIILLSLLLATGTLSVTTDNFTKAPDLSEIGVESDSTASLITPTTEPSSQVKITINETENTAPSAVNSEKDTTEDKSSDSESETSDKNEESSSQDIKESNTSTLTPPSSNLTSHMTEIASQPSNTLPSGTIPNQTIPTNPSGTIPSPVLSLIQEYLQNPLNKFLEETTKSITESLASLFPTPENVVITEPRNSLTTSPNQNLVINEPTLTSPDFKITKQVVDSCRLLINEYENQ